MSGDPPSPKRGQLAAIETLRESMIGKEEDLTEEDRTAIPADLDSLDRNGGIPMEEALADFGLTMADFREDGRRTPMALRVIWSTEARADIRAIDH